MDVALNQPLNDWIEVIGTATTPIALSCEEVRLNKVKFPVLTD